MAGENSSYDSSLMGLELDQKLYEWMHWDDYIEKKSKSSIEEAKEEIKGSSESSV